MFYSATTKGFYSRDIHDSIPSDAVEISAEQYAALLEGQSQGKEITPGESGPVLSDRAPSVPQAVSKFQAKAALHDAGLLNAVEALMTADSTPVLAKLAWQDAQEFRRTSPTVLAMAQALSLDDAALDALFVQAASIEA